MSRKLEEEEKEGDKIGLVFVLVVLIPLIMGEIASWNNPWTHSKNYHSYILGLGGSAVIYFFYSQRIINCNWFLKFIAIGLITLGWTSFKVFSTHDDIGAIIVSAFPLLYILVLRLLLLLFYPNYPSIKKMPIIIYFGKNLREWKGIERGYKPSKIEYAISIVLFLLGLVSMFIAMYFYKIIKF